MGKKCIPGLICIENMTLFLLFVILLILGYTYYTQYVKITQKISNQLGETKIIIVSPPTQNVTSLASIATRSDTLNDPYAPPVKNDGVYFPKDSGDVRGIPVNIKTQSINSSYSQIGILTRSNGQKGDLILPLMGRKIMSGRDKWQYYTISNTGNLNTKLPVSLKGKNCSGEYGCDDISNGDVVYVEGYNDTFKATIYENSLFQYIPYL
jgi:hypothetical protein